MIRAEKYKLLTRNLGDTAWLDRLSPTKDASHLLGTENGAYLRREQSFY
jgi:hypothetical protein